MKVLASPVLVAISLSACAQMGVEQPRWPWNDAAAPQAQRPVEPQSHAQAAQRPAARPSPELKALRPSPRPPAEKEVAILPSSTVTPPKLVGLSEDETADLLGRPAEENAEPPGKIWVYKASGCRLSVHLFPDMEKGGFYALDYTADAAKEACLGKVAGEARRKGSAVIEESKRG